MNEHLCPLCNRPNECMVAERAENCWCMKISVPKTLLAHLTDSDRNVCCICKRCIEQHQK